ncbi:hypothetical protein ACFU7Y_28085 [Kitasatospora sp. NPDC057542]|uniref:hypothetical protein n=1 Tax=Kitasatospora sp. NPDC057542 TaxID=3346162 RepID=UPI00368E449A
MSEYLTSVCTRMGISIQPVRLRTGRDKGPIERSLRLARFLPQIAQGGTDVLTAICLLAEYLYEQAVPIDYARRRTLNGNRLLPEVTWLMICDETGMHPEDHYRLPAVRRFLYQRMTGSDLYSPSRSLNLDSSSRSQAMPVILTAPLLDALDRHAADYLTLHDITEPVTWSPPLALVDHLDLPGRGLILPDTTEAAMLMQTRRMSPTATARALGTSPECLRLAFETRQ